jgi:hypothetical protein
MRVGSLAAALIVTVAGAMSVAPVDGEVMVDVPLGAATAGCTQENSAMIENVETANRFFMVGARCRRYERRRDIAAAADAIGRRRRVLRI